MAAALLVILFLLFFGAMIAALVFWIMKIIEVVQIPDPQYRMAGTDKTTWVLVVILAGAVGALVWQFAKRADVRNVPAFYGQPFAGSPQPAQLTGPPPGWYPEQGTGWVAFWDGFRWTGARQPPPG